jgi:hypothetical protein
MQDGKRLAYFFEVILPTGTVLLKKCFSLQKLTQSSAITYQNVWDENGVNFKETHFSIFFVKFELNMRRFLLFPSSLSFRE